MPLNQISLRFDGEVLCYFEQERHEKYTITDIDPPWDVTFEGKLCKRLHIIWKLV